MKQVTILEAQTTTNDAGDTVTTDEVEIRQEDECTTFISSSCGNNVITIANTELYEFAEKFIK